MGSLHGFGGCLSTYSSKEESQTFHENRCGKTTFSVQNNLFRTELSTSSVYKGHDSSGDIHETGSKMFLYLDDWLLVAKSREELVVQRNQLWMLCVRLELLINVPKSQLVPAQEMVYLGARLFLKEGQAGLTEERIKKILKTGGDLVKKDKCVVKEVVVFLGVLASCIEVLPWARLHMRPIQLYLLAL